ncbi:hypothetical protein MJO29_014161 [Puccinia striiformis f. sp. tritici]|nr:hypothetical protein MJO29_014161 [Puccinia striiformis f. sp. tritici]
MDEYNHYQQMSPMNQGTILALYSNDYSYLSYMLVIPTIMYCLCPHPESPQHLNPALCSTVLAILEENQL